MTFSTFGKLPESSEQGQALNFDNTVKICTQYLETSPAAPLPLSSIPCPNGEKKKKNPLKDLALKGCISWHYFLGRQVSAVQNKKRWLSVWL